MMMMMMMMMMNQWRLGDSRCFPRFSDNPPRDQAWDDLNHWMAMGDHLQEHGNGSKPFVYIYIYIWINYNELTTSEPWKS